MSSLLLSISRSLGLTLLVAAVLLAAPEAEAQTGEDVLRFGQRQQGQSARAVGLAGAGVAGVADWGAAVVNPAGLGLVRGSHVTGSFDVTAVGDEAISAETLTRTTYRLNPGHAAYVARVPTVQGAFVVGLGYHQTSTLDREMFYTENLVGGGRATGEIYETGYMGELSGVAAVEVAPRVFAGASANFVIGGYSFTDFLAVNGSPEESLGLRTDLRGFNLRGGLVAEAVPGIRVGLTVETPNWLYAEESFDFDGGLPTLSEYSFQTPWRASVGAAYDVGGILVAADLSFADWTQARLRPSTRFEPENRDIQRSMRETFDVRIGAEYDFGLGAARAGYAYAQDPLRDEVAVDRTRNTVAAGFSFYPRPGVTLDFGVSFTDFQDQVFPLGEPVREEIGVFRILGGIQLNLPETRPRRR